MFQIDPALMAFLLCMLQLRECNRIVCGGLCPNLPNRGVLISVRENQKYEPKARRAGNA
ncbi:hypothetical protein GCM10010937_03870 [Gluconobacter japonicus]|uniref:Uncharacterized protein n=1 Tax=Gluconobacter japonicus TaxID=376620 RepID=A0ABQ5WGJ9_GLUJA|nr:hypothetical protein AA3271_0182 [Gluconobacter japonicus NBRC 3271]GLQ58585.1 hypothetical protein GCM10010937_03870 [Gluconobacter japonicus]